METKCIRCKHDAELNEVLDLVDFKVTANAKCTTYDCGGEQRHTFVCENSTCPECQNSPLRVNSY